MKIEILGAGCSKCRTTKKLITRVLQDLQVDAEVVEVSDLDEIINRGVIVMVTPGVIIDGELKSTGRVPSKEEIEDWLFAKLSSSGDTEAGDREAEDSMRPELCACLYYAMEQAKMIKKEPSLYKLTCKGCGIEFSSNMKKDYCFDCEKRRR